MLRDICSITALFRTAAVVRFRVFAIFSAPVFCLANFFKAFKSSDVQGFLVSDFATTYSYDVCEGWLITKDDVRCKSNRGELACGNRNPTLPSARKDQNGESAPDPVLPTPCPATPPQKKHV
jgi:hypothetical protein